MDNDNLVEMQLRYLQAVLRSDCSMESKINELLPLQELLTGEVLGDLPIIKSFIEDNWYRLSKILFFVRVYDSYGLHQDLLNILIRYTPKGIHKDDILESGAISA
jgi:hypothetical protein